jgi:polar amino acid transport system substrate-binding protein
VAASIVTLTKLHHGIDHCPMFRRSSVFSNEQRDAALFPLEQSYNHSQVFFAIHLMHLFTGIFLCFCSTAVIAAVPLKFCYEDKMLTPYYLGVGSHVPIERPGASIEHLQLLVQKVPQLQLELIRMPWKRCLAAIANNDVDAIIASYRPERTDIGRYPMLAQRPDPKRAFAEHHTCLVSRKDAQWSWDGQKIIGTEEIVIGRSLGYAAIPSPKGQTFHMHYTLSGTMDLDLLKKGRINAVTTLCNINNQPFIARFITDRDLKVLQPPLYRNTGYLVFSHQFYQQHPKLSELLWQQLSLHKGSEIYQRYLNDELN